MSDQMGRMVKDTMGTGHQFMQSYQSVWMSRWKRTGCNSTKKALNGSSNTFPKMKLDCANGEDNSANKLKVSKSVKSHEEIVTKTFETVNESPRKDSTSAASKRLLESFAKSSSNAGPFIFEPEHSEFDQGKPSVPSFNGRSALISSNRLTDAKLKLGERQYHHYHEVDGHSRPRNSVTVCFRESNTSSFFDLPSMSGHHLSELGGEWFQEMQKISGFRLLPSHLDTSEKTEVKKSLYDCYSLQKVPKCMHNVETMRICTTMDSVIDPGGSRMRITKKTDVNLENDIFRSTRILGDTPCDLYNLSPLYGQVKRGLKIQSLSNFTNSGSKGNYVRNSEVSAKNESSVQEKDPLSGATSTPSKKVNNMSSTLSQYQCIKVSVH